MADEIFPTGRRGDYLKQWAALESARSLWMADWFDDADYVDPWNFRYSLADTNKGGKRARKIINDTAGDANDIQAAGMMAGITSPASPWFELKTKDPGLKDYGPAREWLDQAADQLRQLFWGSNVYESFHNGYINLGQFGTHCQLLSEDPEDTLRVYVFPLGEFCLATSERGVVDTVYRKHRMTVKQIIQWANNDKDCNPSTQVKNLYERGAFQQSIDILHVIEPNQDHQPGALGPRGKAFLSTYMEMGAQDSWSGPDDFLCRKGYSENPCQSPRWRAMNGNVYGVSPATKAMGDIKGLQELERMKGKAAQKIVDPPMVGPTSMMNERTSILPGAMNYVDQVSASQVFRPAMDINPNALTTVEASLRPHESRIQKRFRADLWMLMANGEGDPQKTAREVAELHDEKMMQLGPVMQSIEREYLGPLIHRALAIAIRVGAIPAPPPELLRHGYTVEYMSIVARALRMIQNNGIEQELAFAGRLAAARPEVLDNYNLDAVVREHAANIGIKVSLLNPQDVVSAIRQDRQKQAEQQAQADQAQKLAQGAQTLSQTNLSGNNALTHLLSNIPGAPAGGSIQ